jgi:hypothetical protein
VVRSSAASDVYKRQVPDFVPHSTRILLYLLPVKVMVFYTSYIIKNAYMTND